MIAIFWKEMADHFGRRRFVFLLALVFLAIIWALSVIFGTVEKAASSREEFLFLRVFSSQQRRTPVTALLHQLLRAAGRDNPGVRQHQ